MPAGFLSPSSPILTKLTSNDLDHDPIVHVDEGRGPRNGFIHIGPDIVGSAERLPLDMRQAQLPLSAAGDHDGIKVSYGTQVDGLRNGISTRVLYAFDIGTDGAILRFGKMPPVVEIGGEATAEMVSDLVLIVQQINTALPPDWQLAFVTDKALRTREPGRIFVTFAPEVTGSHDATVGTAEKQVYQGVVQSAQVIVEDHYWIGNQNRETGRPRSGARVASCAGPWVILADREMPQYPLCCRE